MSGAERVKGLFSLQFSCVTHAHASAGVPHNPSCIIPHRHHQGSFRYRCPFGAGVDFELQKVPTSLAHFAMYSVEHFLIAKLLAQRLYSLTHLKASAPRIWSCFEILHIGCHVPCYCIMRQLFEYR